MFTTQQTATLRATVDRIIPPDDFPGGWDAGVGAYLEHQLHHDLQPLLDTYRAGLDAFEAEALAVAGLSFAALDPPVQDALLARVEAGDVRTVWPVAPALFFSMLIDHAMEGYYGDPGNGGNRDPVAWRMIGFEVRG